MNINLKIEVFKEDDVYVALAPELNVSSFGETIDEAKASLKEAIEAFVEACEQMGTLYDVLEESGFQKINDVWTFKKPVAEEEFALAI